MDLALEAVPAYSVPPYQDNSTKARVELQRFETDRNILTRHDIEKRMMRIFTLLGIGQPNDAGSEPCDTVAMVNYDRRLHDTVTTIRHVLDIGAMHNVRAARSMFFTYIFPCARTGEPVPENVVESVREHIQASGRSFASLDKSGRSNAATMELALTDPVAALLAAPWLERKGKQQKQAYLI